MPIAFASSMPREWPSHLRAVVESQFYPQTVSLSAESTLGASEEFYGPVKTRFLAKLTWPQLKRDHWREVSGFLASLRGPNKNVRLVDYHRMRCGYDVAVKPSIVTWSDGSTWDDGSGWENGYLPPFVTIDESAVVDSNSVVVRFPTDYANLENVFRPGDLVEVRPNGAKVWHAHLYEIVATSRLNASAKTRIYFEPGLRAGVNAGDQLVLRYPTSVFRLAAGQDPVISRTAPGNFGNVGLSFVEVLP